MDKEDVVPIYNEILFSHIKKEIMSFVTICINLESTEIRQRKQNTISLLIYMEFKKQKANSKRNPSSQIQKIDWWKKCVEGQINNGK